MAGIIDFSSKNIVSQKVYQETVNQLGHFILIRAIWNLQKNVVEQNLQEPKTYLKMFFMFYKFHIPLLFFKRTYNLDGANFMGYL